jgi:hypothetical protein
MKPTKTTAAPMQIDGALVRETDRAIYVNVTGCHSSVWLPKSQLAELSRQEEREHDGYVHHFFSATIPAWLADRLPWNQTTAVAHRPW